MVTRASRAQLKVYDEAWALSSAKFAKAKQELEKS